MEQAVEEKFCGQPVSANELNEIREVVDTFKKLSRTELANTICELNSWKRPTGKLKTIECRQFLEKLDEKGLIRLPAADKVGRTRGTKITIKKTTLPEKPEIVSGTLKQFLPIRLEKVISEKERKLWYEYVDRYHYLGYHQPFGAQLRYFVKSEKRPDLVLGCLQFSSPAWMMAPRDEWIQWSHEQRKRNLQLIVSNSRFLILPWIQIRNLASSALSLAIKVVPDDWYRSYKYQPVLMESMVDPTHFKGTCYKAANWVHVGTTTGRGRMDRENKRFGFSPKEIFLYPLTPRFREVLLS